MSDRKPGDDPSPKRKVQPDHLGSFFQVGWQPGIWVRIAKSHAGFEPPAMIPLFKQQNPRSIPLFGSLFQIGCQPEIWVRTVKSCRPWNLADSLKQCKSQSLP
jgi:hypothetical protein